MDRDDFEPRWEELETIIRPALAEGSPGFEAIKVANESARHYGFNALDLNLIVGRDPRATNFVWFSGFSEHGLQQGPSAGRGVAELIIYRQFRSLDLSDVAFQRIFGGRLSLEKAVI